MTVKELILELSKLDPTAEVYVENRGEHRLLERHDARFRTQVFDVERCELMHGHFVTIECWS